MQAPTTLLLVLPLPVFRAGNRMLIDDQALNGLNRWLDNFDRLILCMPELPASEAPANVVLLDLGDRAPLCRLQPLPSARTPRRFLRWIVPTTKLLDGLIDQSTHLSFAIGGLFGDWAAIAALRAHRKGRRASVWTDRVESAVAAFTAQHARGLRRIYGMAQASAMRHLERAVIRRTAVGLFHGADCYSAYASYSPQPHLVHDIHLGEDARIPPDELTRKINRARSSRSLTIVYVGRAHRDKGTMDWVETLKLLAARGIAFTATWIGEGPEKEAAQAAVSEADLSDRIIFSGGMQNREAVLQRLRDADIFLFCHRTLESPRCLIEAIISGTPIVGYGSAYPEDLIARHGGGSLTDHRPEALAQEVERIAGNRNRLADLVTGAAADGLSFTDKAVFEHRSTLIKGM